MTSSALILGSPQPQQETALLLRRGPGLTVFQFVESGAKLIDSCLNAIYRHGGPKGPKDKIDNFFSKYEARQGFLDELYKSDWNNLTKQHKKLRGYCQDLLKYARAQSYSVSTQLVTFKMLVAIITRYPGIRRLFYHPNHCGQALSTFKEHWTWAHQNCGEGWNFYLDYTLHCLSDNDLTTLVEKNLPSELGRLELPENDWNKVPIEELLSFCSTIPELDSLCAIRYLAGILELPTFWEKGINDQGRFSDILTVLCDTIFKLIQDTEADADVDLNGDFPPWMSAARDAADILASATFGGLLRLHERNRLVSPCPPRLPNIVDLLQRSEMNEAYPKASDRASRVDGIIQRAERDIRVDSPELTTHSTSVEHDISTQLGEAYDKPSLHNTVEVESLHSDQQSDGDRESANIESEMNEAFPKASDRGSPVDGILQSAERDITSTDNRADSLDNPSISRKFIDLIFQATAKWANWDPLSDIKVGDYGTVDEMTGQFHREGNIYNDMHIYQDGNIANLVKDHYPITALREDVFIAASRGVKHSDLMLGVEAEDSAIPGLAEASIKGQWTFGPKRGALLIMANPCCSYIPPATILKHLAEVEALQNMLLVTEVFSCPAYCLYLSSKTAEVVNLALTGTLPVPHAPGATAGVETEGKWWAQNANGLFRSAREPYGKDNYTPLYTLKSIRKTRAFFSRR